MPEQPATENIAWPTGSPTASEEDAVRYVQVKAVTNSSGSADLDAGTRWLTRHDIYSATTKAGLGPLDWAQIPLPPGDRAIRAARSLRALGEDWDSHGSVAVGVDAVKRAQEWVRFAITVIGEASWIEPLVTASAEGDIVLEWWHETRKLTVYLSSTGAEHVRVWGPDIHANMDDGEADSPDSVKTLWQWLFGPNR